MYKRYIGDVYITYITLMVGLVGISSIHRFSHDQTNSQLHKVCRCPRRRCRCLRVPTGPKNTRPRRKAWVVCVELSFFWFGRQKWLTLQIECPTLQLRSWFDSSKKFWTSEKLLKICYFAGFPSSKLVVQFLMMNGPFSPKVSGLCSCAPIFADARHRGYQWDWWTCPK